MNTNQSKSDQFKHGRLVLSSSFPLQPIDSGAKLIQCQCKHLGLDGGFFQFFFLSRNRQTCQRVWTIKGFRNDTLRGHPLFTYVCGPDPCERVDCPGHSSIVSFALIFRGAGLSTGPHILMWLFLVFFSPASSHCCPPFKKGWCEKHVLASEHWFNYLI